MAAHAPKLSEEATALLDLALHWQELGVESDYDGKSLNHVTPFPKSTPISLDQLEEIAASDKVFDRAMGSMVGMAVADSVGHPLEFIDVAPESGEGESSWSLNDFLAAKEPYAGYTRPYNAFMLDAGQWTDDTSMGLCLADSLLKCGKLDGSDARLFFWSWWHCGLNNAFRKHATRCDSIGLGGNICKSLKSMKPGVTPAPIYDGGSEDAGNGSLMRLAPVAVFHHSDESSAATDASKSSYTTHPGAIAAEACSFMAHLIVVAMRDFDPKAPAAEASKGSVAPKGSVARSFLCGVADKYEAMLGETRPNAPGVSEVRRLLRSAEPDGKEMCWNWRSPKLRIGEVMAARGRHYNGYPNSAGYFGSFCIDGLAMALNAVAWTDSFDEAVERCVNFLGDADSHGSMAGQIAGAMYGYGAINAKFKSNLHRWDEGQVAMRAALLVRRKKEEVAVS